MLRTALLKVSAPPLARAFAAAAAGSEALPSFSRALFQGKLESGAVYPYPNTLSQDQLDELKMAVDSLSSFCEARIDPVANDKNGAMPQDVMDELKTLGAYGLQVPTELGGMGMSNAAYARTVEVVGRRTELGGGIHLGAHQSIGFKALLLPQASAFLKEKYLPKVASGEWVAAFALTEPGAGSDAANIKTRAKLSADGKHWVLNGSKIWISNGPIAKLFTVFAKTEVLDAKTGTMKDKMTAFIVERDFGGVTHGALEDKMGIKASPTTEVYFNDTKIPVENVVGEPGQGFYIAMEVLNNGRFGMGAALSGLMKTIVEQVTAHCEQRIAFGKKLSEFEHVRGQLASMSARLYAVESLAYLLANNMDRGQKDYQIEAAASKVLASEAAWWVADEALQLVGGLGFMKALPYERYLRDLRIFRIFEGSSSIMRQMIGLTGLQSAGKALEPLQAAAKAPLSNLPLLAQFGVQQLKSRLGMVDRPYLSWAPKELRPAADTIELAAGQLGDLSRALLMKHGKRIVEQQAVVERVADIVIDLTAATAAMSRAAAALERREPGASQEVALANLYAEEAKARLAANIKFARGGGRALVKLQHAVAADMLAAGKYHAKHPLGF